jgi:outer membrane protein OmpA-like peptidoglycan-associated protein
MKYNNPLFAILAIGLLASCSTQSGPTFTARVISTVGERTVYRVTCGGLFESSKSCMSAAKDICEGKQVVLLQTEDGITGSKPSHDPREIIFRCDKPEAAAAPAPVPPPPPPPAPQRPPVSQMQQTVVTFDTNVVMLSREAQARLDLFVAANRGVSLTRVTVSGYTDSTGSASGNRQLSQARAEVVARYLQAKGLQAQQFLTKGYSNADPVASNANEQGRAQNRRAEVRITAN